MYIFLDESGDLGFDTDKNNSKFFVVTILAVRNKKPIEKIVKKVHQNLRKKVKRLSGGILHAYKEKPETRRRVLIKTSHTQSAIMTIYLNKSKVYTKLQDEKHVLYNYVTNILLDRIIRGKLLSENDGIYLIPSRRETNKFLNINFKSYLEKQMKMKHKAKIEVIIKTPSEEKSLQVVDFVCWAVFRKYEFGDSKFYNLIKNRIIEESPLFP